MLYFPQEFFQGETRCDFYVDATMKSVWAAELEVLAAIAGVCEKYQIPWFAAYGTLLGAVRHQGFVPWDDDMDIMLLRDDYERLMEVLEKELPKGYRVHHSGHGLGQEQFWACVMNSNEISIEQDRLENFHGCPFIVGIDIFPLDGIPKNKKAKEMEEALFTLVWKTVQLAKKEEKTRKDEKDLLEAIKAIEASRNAKIDRSKDLVNELWRVGNEVVKSYNSEDDEQVVSFLSYMKNRRKIFRREWFEDVEYLPFENVEIPVPIGYKEWLTANYGDYSILKKFDAAHDYPFYNKQLEQLRNIVREMEEKAQKGGN